MNSLDPTLLQRVKAASCAVQALAAQEMFVFSADERTQQFCKTYLQTMMTQEQLMQKVSNELRHTHWEPLGRLLLIVSENDVLGTTLAFLGAYITGNQMIIKARESRTILDFLKQELALDDEEVQILDWQGGEQDDLALLSKVDGVLLAGGATLIQHFRQVAPPRIRLIEYGPKHSAIALGKHLTKEMLPKVVELLVEEVSVFQQQVCSSPQFICVESKEIAATLFRELSASLASMPVLDLSIRLAQASKYAELSLLKQAAEDGDVSKEPWRLDFNATTGWAVTSSTQLEPTLWFGKGFHLIVGSIHEHMEVARRFWKGSLQTLGVVGVDKEDMNCQGFTRYCALGEMHKRPITDPHDGFFELSALVSFMGKDIG